MRQQALLSENRLLISYQQEKLMGFGRQKMFKLQENHGISFHLAEWEKWRFPIVALAFKEHC